MAQTQAADKKAASDEFSGRTRRMEGTIWGTIIRSWQLLSPFFIYIRQDLARFLW